MHMILPCIHGSNHDGKVCIDNEWGEPTTSYKLSWLSLRNNGLKFKTLEKNTSHVRRICEKYLRLIK